MPKEAIQLVGLEKKDLRLENVLYSDHRKYDRKFVKYALRQVIGTSSLKTEGSSREVNVLVSKKRNQSISEQHDSNSTDFYKFNGTGTSRVVQGKILNMQEMVTKRVKQCIFSNGHNELQL